MRGGYALTLGMAMMLAGMIVPPLAGWRILSDNTRTRMRLSAWQQDHAASMQERPWRSDFIATGADPRTAIALFLRAWKARDNSPFLPVYTQTTRRMLRRRRLAPALLHARAREYENCGRAIIRRYGDKARAVFADLKGRSCPPLFLRREKGRWRVDLTDGHLLPANGQEARSIPAIPGEAAPAVPFDREFTLRQGLS